MFELLAHWTGQFSCRYSERGDDTVDDDDVFDGLPVITDDTSALSEPAALSEAVARFEACRWRRAAENGTPACCGHRDVLPMTGANGFDAEAWCSDCGLYKLRRTRKKRDDWDVHY
jgi:hypothetical protein